MGKKIGRPKVENPLCVIVKAKIDEPTKDKLEEYCKQSGKTVSDIIREGINLILGESKK